MMPSFSLTDAAFEGFRFTRERPGAVAAWAAVTFAFNIGSGVLGALVGGDALRAVHALGGHPTIAEIAAVFPPAAAPLLVTFLVNFAGAAFIYSSAIRSVLGIDRTVKFSVGNDERRLFLILVCGFLLYLVINIFIGVAFGVIESITSIFGSFIPDFLYVIAPIVLIIVPIYIIIRLSLVPVIAIDRKRINMKESWVSTKGHFWPLAGSIVLSLVLFCIVAAIAIVLVMALGEVASISTGGAIAKPGDILNGPEAEGFLTPALVFGGLVAALLIGVLLPVVLGPQVRAYQAYDAPDPVGLPA